MKLAKYSTKALLALTIAAAASVTCAAQDRAAEGSFDRTLKVSGAVNLTVETGSGSIAVRAGDSSSVHISAKIRVNEGWHVSMNEAKDKVSKLEANPPIRTAGQYDSHRRNSRRRTAAKCFHQLRDFRAC